MELGVIQAATQDLYESLKILVGEHVQTTDLNYQNRSSHYASANSKPDSDSPRAPQRMSLGPSGAKNLRSRVSRPDQRLAGPSQTSEKPDRQEKRQISAGRTTPTTYSTRSSKLDEYFQMAMNRFLKKQSLVTAQPPLPGTQDIDMESVGTPDQDTSEYDPDDLGIPSSSGHTSGRAAVATTAIDSGNSSSLIQRVRISAISDRMEFTGKDMDEDRQDKVGFQRDQATEEEKCLTLMLSRTTKTKWADLLEIFQTQYCGLGISEETPLDYLYRLNVAALRAKLKIKDGNPKARREHVDHYIETLGDPEFADRLTLLRLADVDELEEVLRARERAKSRQRRSAFGSKFQQKAPASAPAAPARAMVRAIQAQDPTSESEGVSRPDRSDSEGELRGDPELANRLTLLQLADVDELEEVLRARERAKSRQRRSAFGSKFRQKAPASAPAAPARAMVRAIQAQDPSSESEGVSRPDGSDSEGELQRIFLAAAEKKMISTGGASQNSDPSRPRTKAYEGGRIPDRRNPRDRDHQDRDRCSHCGSRKQTYLDCWKRLTCENCGKRGHPTNRCLYVCRGCGDVHEAGKCPMEEFYNPIRKRYDPTQHAGLFPEQGRSPGWNTVRAVRSRYCIYAYVNKATTDRVKKESDLRGNT
ncbi:hypothetical protein PHMEG_00028155, partial [Phytophthora megakarya]